MSHEPHASFDQTVLDKIEQSPVGAVPHTPAYQDGLARLLASHQVYVSADYKGGHVTVRSLAALPLFCAHNLEAVLAGTTPAAELESDTNVFNRYVESLPATLRDKAEAARVKTVGRRAQHRVKAGADAVVEPLHALFLVPGAGPHPGLPGNYLYGLVIEHAAGWSVLVHDAEDGAALCDVLTQADALEKFQEVLASAPFQLSELQAVGFRSN